MSFRTLLTTLLQIPCKIIFNSKCIIESIIGPVDNFRGTTKHERANNHKHLEGKKNQKTFLMLDKFIYKTLTPLGED